MKQKPDPITCAYGARQIAAHLSSFSAEIEGARSAGDIEHIHQLRVYSRRLRSTMPLFITCMPKKQANSWFSQIKKITGSLGEARDLDVQIEFLTQFSQNLSEKKYLAGMDRLVLRLTQKRQRIQKKVIKALDDLEHAGTITEMSEFLQNLLPDVQEEKPSYPLGLYHLAFNAIHPAWQSFIEYEQFIADPEKVKELHEMRIAAKSLRYTVEVFAPIYRSRLKQPYSAIKESQELLGTIHDMDVWAEFIPTFIEQESEKTRAFYGKTTPLNFILPGLNFFEDHVRSKREETYVKFLQNWQTWKNAGVWTELIASIRMPSFPKDALIEDPQSGPIVE